MPGGSSRDPSVQIDSDTAPSERYPFQAQPQALLLTAFPGQCNPAPGGDDTMPW